MSSSQDTAANNPIATAPDSAADEWVISDQVVQLRQWGTSLVFPLPEPPITTCVIGSTDTCSLQLVDPSGLLSRQHARLVRRAAMLPSCLDVMPELHRDKWIAHDLSKNGLRLDGARRAEFELDPGIELGVGDITLIAESAKLIALRGFLARLLGWASDRTAVVDHALRTVRMAATNRATLVLCGAGDLVPVARSLHRHTLGPDRPFVTCDPRRRRSKGNVRSAPNFKEGLAALQAASGGSLGLLAWRPPADISEVLAALRDPRTRVQLIVCTQERRDSERYLAVPITVPALPDRASELDRIIFEYAQEAIAELGGCRPPGFTSDDHAWVRNCSSQTLPEIEKGTRRLVALRQCRNISQAASRLGMAPVSLSRWLDRRPHHPSSREASR